MGNALLYVGEGTECTNPNPSRLSLMTYSVDVDNLLSTHMRYGFESRSFEKDLGWRRGGKCYALAALPTYDVAKIVVGQVGKDPFDLFFHPLWQASYSPRTDGESRS